MDIDKIDTTQAFLQSDDLPEGSNLYLVPPPEAEADSSIIWKLIKPLYCLSITPQAWSQTLQIYVTSKGWCAAAFEDTVYSYTKGDIKMLLTFHVDDILLSYNSAACETAAAFK